MYQKKRLSLKTAFFIFFFLSSSIDLFAGSKKVFIEETRAAQEDRLNFANVTGAAQPNVTSPVMNEEQWLMTVYLKGKEYYDQGDYQAAVTEWKKAGDVVERYPAFKTVISYLTGREKTLSQAAVQQVDKRLEDRRRQIEQTFQRGKQYYDKNDMDKALAEWDRLALYLPDDAPQRRLIADLKSYYGQSQIVPKEADPITKELSGEMLRFFASAAEMYKTQAQQAKGALSAAENAQEMVGSGFQKAKLLYYEGSYDKAIEELEKIKPFFKANSSEAESLEMLSQIYHQAQGEKQAAESAMKGKNIKVKMPAEFSKFVEEIHEKFKLDLKEAETQRRARERSFEDQQSWMAADFKKGLESYKAGNTDQAIAEWEKVAPNFENEETVRQLIDKVKKQTAEIQKVRLEQEKSLKEKQALINGTLENGRLLYQAGKYEQAAQEWGNISSLFEDPTRFQEFVKAMGEIHQNTTLIEKAKMEAKAKSATKFKTPDSLISILTEAKERLKKETDATEIEKQKAQKSQQIQELINKSLQLGRELAQAGKIDEAVTEWSKISKYFEDSDKFQEFIRFMTDISKDLSQAQTAKREALTVSGVKVKTPDSLITIISESKEKLTKEIEAAEIEKQRAQKTLQTQEFIKNTIDNGRILAQAGKIDEAITEWSKVADHFDDANKFQEFIRFMASTGKELNQVQAAKQQALQVSGVAIKTPDSLISIISESKEKLKNEIEATEIEKQKAKKTQQTQEFIKNTIESGRVLAQSGKIDEAIKEWSKVANYFEDAAKFQEFIQFMNDINKDLTAAQGVKKDASALASTKIQTPPVLSSILAEAKGRLKKETDAGEIEKQKAQKNQQTQEFIKTTIENGRLLAQAGKIDEAVTEWTKVSNYFEDSDKFQEFLQLMNDINKDLISAQNQRKEASARAGSKIQTPPVLNAFLSDAKVKLKQETDAAELEGQKAKKAEQVQSLIETTLESGRLLAKSGQYGEAVKEWSKIASLFEDSKNFESFLKDIASIQIGIEQAQKSRQEALNKANIKFRTPADLSLILDETKTALRAKMEDARLTQSKSEQSLTDRQNLVRQTITSGKMLLESGKWEEAVKTWREILPYLDDEEKIAASIVELENMQQAKQKAEISAREAELKKESKISTPEDMEELIKQAIRQIEVQAETAQSRKRKADLSLADRQTLTSEGYDKGKKLLADGQYTEAFQEWQKILPNFEDVVTVKPLLDRAGEQTQLLIQWQKSAKEAESKKDLKVKSPADFNKLLEAAMEKIKTETEMAKTKRGVAEESYASRESLVQNTFEKGKILYDQGQYAEALDVWKKMLSELSDADKIRASIGQIEDSYEKLITARKGTEESEKKQKLGISSPAAFRAMLDEIGQKLKIQTESSEQRKQDADKLFKEKESKAEAIFAKGKLLYDEGKVAEAFYEWQNMIPYLQDGSQIKQTLEALKADQEALSKSEADAKLAETKKDSKLATPSEFSKVFGDISVKIKSQIQAAQDSQKKHESVLEDRKTMVMTSFEKGKELYADGRFEEAFDTWSLMLPALEDEGVTRQQIEAAKEAYQNLALAEKSAHMADERKDQKLKAPDGFAELISASTDKLKIHTVDVQAQKATADKVFQARQSEMMAKVAEGNKLYEAGRFEDAHAIWLSVMPSIENTQDFQAAVDELSRINDERLKIEKISEQAAALQDVKFPAPAGITAEIVDARAKLQIQLKEAEAHKVKAEQQLASRQAQIQTVFEKGKQAYWDGKLGEAVQEWSSIADSLEDQSIRKSIQTVTESYDTLLKLQRSAQEAELKKDNKLRTPDELPRLLEDAKQIVTSQKTYSETQKKIADQTFVDRQALINTTYEKGKRLYNENRIPEALEEWGTITPYLENGSDLKQFIQGVQQSYDNSLVAKKAAQEAQVKRTIKFQSPENLSALLEDASLKLKAQADESKSKKAEADKTRADRQLFIDSNFIRGKLLYEQGKLTEAIDVWKSLLPYLHDNAKVRELIVKAEASRRELADQQKKSKLEEDVREVILDKKASSSKESQPIANTKVARVAKTGPQLDDIEQMMLDYNIASKTELEKRHQELQAVK